MVRHGLRLDHRRKRTKLSKVPLSAWPGLARRVIRESARDRITMNAASMAFHGFLAMLPVLIALVGLFGLIGLSPGALHTLLHATSVLLPSQMSEEINSQLLKPSSRQVNLAAASLGFAVALWSSIEAMASLQVALDVAYEVPRDRGFIGRRLMATPLIGVTIVLGGVASLLLVLGSPLASLLPSAVAIVRPEYHALLLVIRYGGALILLMLLLSAYYSFAPSHARAHWEWVSPGSVVAALGWVLTSAGLSFYLDNFAHETRTYGALAGVAVTLLWLFVTATVILFGAELNRELERMATEPGVDPDQPAR